MTRRRRPLPRSRPPMMEKAGTLSPSAQGTAARSEMHENLRPGPKPRRKRAADGTLCPPGSEGAKKYRAIRSWRKVCKYRGHPKPHPGRCVICRRASDRARGAKPERKEAKKAARQRWRMKPEAKAKTAAWAKRRNQRQEQKAKNAEKARMYRRRKWMEEIKRQPVKPNAAALRLKALAEARASQASYGIQRIAYQEKR